MDVDLAGKVAVVTGGSRGLGRVMVSALARCGADVVVSSRKQDACDLAAKEVAAETGRRVEAFACHVGRWDQIDTLVDQVYDAFGRVDILVNNAGISPLYPSVTEVTEDLFDKTIGVNLKGPFRLSALMGSRMAEAGGGSIINISSTAAVKPTAYYIPYAAAKAGLNAMTVGYAHALGPKVRVNTVMCGPFETDITAGWDWDSFNQRVKGFALGRIGQPVEIVGAVLYFASDASTYTSGATLTVNGGEP